MLGQCEYFYELRFSLTLLPGVLIHLVYIHVPHTRSLAFVLFESQLL